MRLSACEELCDLHRKEPATLKTQMYFFFQSGSDWWLEITLPVIVCTKSVWFTEQTKIIYRCGWEKCYIYLQRHVQDRKHHDTFSADHTNKKTLPILTLTGLFFSKTLPNSNYFFNACWQGFYYVHCYLVSTCILTSSSTMLLLFSASKQGQRLGDAELFAKWVTQLTGIYATSRHCNIF